MNLRAILTACTALCAVNLLCAAAAPAADAIKPIERPSPRNPDAPNILLVLSDDVGFGAASTFGGPIPTPHYDALADGGLRFNTFHATAMCSPTRAALLTGRNHHRVNMGTIVNIAVGEPGYSSVIPDSAATIGRVLQLNGYSTGWFGKNHVTPEWESTPVGPFDRWPTGLGFDYFYGFMNGATDQFHPSLVENTRTVDSPAEPGYILDRDLADRVIGWIEERHAIAPTQPFMIYLATGTAHEPHQAPGDWLTRFRGQFDRGWDTVRQEAFERQKQLGLVPADAQITPRPSFIPAWDSLGATERSVAARLMEAHAAQRAYFDEQFGRIVATLKETGEWDNTLVIYIDGDNGASAEAGPNGTVLGLLNYSGESATYMASHLDDIGGPGSWTNYPAGWAWAMNAPFPYFKQVASHLGGTRNNMVISWPARIRAPGGVRGQFSHVIDVAPTIYEAAGVTPPSSVDGVQQMSLDGASLLYALNAPDAPSQRRSQYFEMLGNRAYYEDGWMAATTPPSMSWERKPLPPVAEWRWELYNLDEDFTQSHDVAAQHAERLRRLIAGFHAAEEANGFRTLSASLGARVNPHLRPYWTNDRTDFVFHRSDTLLPDYAFPELVNRNWSLSVELEAPRGRANGAIINQGGYPFGWGLYVFSGRPTFLYQNQPHALTRLAARRPLSAGKHTVSVEIQHDSAARGGPATVTLKIDGKVSASQRIEQTVPAFWGHSGVGVGRDGGTAITDDVRLPFSFSGVMGPVRIHVDAPR